MLDILKIGNTEIAGGQRMRLKLPVARLYTDTDVSIPVEVIRGKKQGPCVFISAAIHGDELNGIEVIRRLQEKRPLRISAGTLILVPTVNVYGMINQSRYMPDRRDLNRSFPGSAKGSLAGRVANLFLTEIVSKCQYGIDLHTGAIHRSNFPQIRAELDDDETLKLAKTFGVPVVMNAPIRDGSLRQAARNFGTKVLLYEAGQALRFDELSVRAGVKGIMNVLGELGLVRKRKPAKQAAEPFISNHSAWIRANSSGIVYNHKQLGDKVKKGDLLAAINSPTSQESCALTSPVDGVIIGKQNIPLVHEGDAMFHIADFETPQDVVDHIEQLQDDLLPETEAVADHK